MSVQNGSPDRYDSLSIFFHWVMAALILVLFALGWYMTDLPKGSSERTLYFTLHKSVGLTAAALLVLRMGWRLCVRALPPAPGLARWQERLSVGVHRALYVFMVAQPLSGYISSSYSGYPTRIWGFQLPQWAEKDPQLNQLFTDVHAVSSVVLCALILLHLGGAFWHYIGRHPSVLPRMWPERRAPSRTGE